MRVSVIMCTHDPRADYLNRTLGALERQTLGLRQWEFLLIDNCSNPPIAGRIDVSWHSDCTVLCEEELGLTPARLKGIREAAGDLLVFVDDDNVLDPDYLENAATIADTHPWLGAWSGQCRPEFEAPPPDWTRRYWGNLAIRQFEKDVWSNLPRLPSTLPCGAGLVVRRAVAQHYLHLHDTGVRSIQLDRKGRSLVSGGDNDLAACACDIGLGVGLMANLKLTHLMPPERLTAQYLTRLSEGVSYSGTVLDHARGIEVRPRSVFGRAVDFLRTLRLASPHRQILAAHYRGRNRAARELANASAG